jgi:imidazole glycerol phosphate synthase subunit HisF
VKPPSGKKEALLDPNHTHFLLVDTGSSAFGAEIHFRAELEKKIAEELNIPITVLVVGGGFRTAGSIAEAVSKGTPCVFLEVEDHKKPQIIFFSTQK